MNIKSLIYEEIVNYIIFITGLTKNGSLKWRCNHYIPPAFCDCLSSSPEDFIIEQRLTLTAHLKTRMVRISISESTDIENKNGDMDVTVQVFTNHRQKLYTIYTAYFPSHDRDPYHLLPLCDVLFKQETSWLPKYAFRHFEETYYEYANSHKMKIIASRLSITGHMKSIWRERSALTFHNLVCDRVKARRILKGDILNGMRTEKERNFIVG